MEAVPFDRQLLFKTIIGDFVQNFITCSNNSYQATNNFAQSSHTHTHTHTCIYTVIETINCYRLTCKADLRRQFFDNYRILFASFHLPSTYFILKGF